MGKESEERKRRRELQNARNEKAGYESSKSAKENVYNANSKKIERLKKVKTNLEKQKAAAKDRYRSLKNYSEDTGSFGEWAGEKYQKTVNEFNNTIVPGYESYVERIDEVLDAVCDEMTRLQNENMQLNGDILHLASLINSLINKIRTLCN